jgi:uncharacterized protein (DUF58 family)
MCEPVGGLPRIDRAVSAALSTAYVALKGGDKAALFGFAARPELFTPFVPPMPAIFPSAPRRRRAGLSCAGAQFHAGPGDAGRAAAAPFADRGVLDFTDPTSAELMVESIGRLAGRHVVLFVTMTDEELTDLWPRQTISSTWPWRSAPTDCCASARWCWASCASWAWT